VSFFDRKEPWYIGGLAFECQNCGRCCAGPEEGYVWLNEREIAAIAGFLGMPDDQLRQKYVRRVGARFSLREHKPSCDCIFLSADGLGRRTCGVYPVRPAQCRTWPYWPVNLRQPENWSAAAARCRGVNRGRIISFNEIETRRIETSDD
jgi:hypothetical protein